MVRNLGELGLNLQKIVSRLLTNQNLLKYLYYTDKDPLNHEDLTSEQIENEIYEKLVKVVPRVGPKETAASIVTLRVVRARTNPGNDEFDNIEIHIEVFCPLTQWFVKNSNLRPFCILSEINNSINRKRINGLGQLINTGFQLNFLTDEISCYEAHYELVEYE